MSDRPIGRKRELTLLLSEQANAEFKEAVELMSEVSLQDKSSCESDILNAVREKTREFAENMMHEFFESFQGAALEKRRQISNFETRAVSIFNNVKEGKKKG